MPDPNAGVSAQLGPKSFLPESSPESLVTVLDKLLDTGVVADGQLVLSVAGVDLIYVGLRALLASMDTASRMMLAPAAPKPASSGSACSASTLPQSVGAGAH